MTAAAAPGPPLDLLCLTATDLAAELGCRYGKGMYHAAALTREVFRKGSLRPFEAPEFARSPALAEDLARVVRLPRGRVTLQTQQEGVLKFVITLEDGLAIESVIIPAQGRTTLCVSSQVGCRMGCRFCATGAMGFVRNLDVAEIVGQVVAARFELGQAVDNLVFMGMGEPLDNFDALMGALRVMGDPHGLAFGPRHITISTAGHGEGIRRLAARGESPIRLAVSLNAAENGLRSALMPVNRQTPLEELKELLMAFPLSRGGVFLIEYVLLAGVNDSREHAQKLARFLEGLPVRVNVIAYNGGIDEKAPFVTPTAGQVGDFCRWLAEQKVFVRARSSRGGKIRAACGQLGGMESRSRGALAFADQGPVRSSSHPPADG